MKMTSTLPRLCFAIIFVLAAVILWPGSSAADDQTCTPYEGAPWIQRKSIVINDETFAEGKLRIYPGVMILQLYGTPYQMGRQHGAMLKNEIADIIESRKTEVKINGGEIYMETLRAMITYKNKWPKWAVEEIKGISDGAGVPLMDLVWLNTYQMDAPNSQKTKADWMPDYGVAFYHRQGQYKVAGIIKPGMVGTMAGVNETGCFMPYDGGEGQSSLDRIKMSYALGTGMCDIKKNGPKKSLNVSGDLVNIVFSESTKLLCLRNEDKEKGAVDFKSEEYYRECPICQTRQTGEVTEANVE